jgi:ABC-type branched-subunit amino acid transport system substrate-binding protein
MQGGSLRITEGCSISNSSASVDGGTVAIYSGTFTAVDSALLYSVSVAAGGAMDIRGGVVRITRCRIAQLEASMGGCFKLLGGELHLVGAVIESSLARGLDGHIINMPSGALGDGPLLIATFTEFRQHACDGPLFSQHGSARILLRETTFTPLAGCDPLALASPAAFAGVAPMRCGDTYADEQQQLRSVCSSAALGSCEAGDVSGTSLQSLRCRCPSPEEKVNPNEADVTLAPYLPSGGCIEAATGVVRLGMLLPMFGTETAGYGQMLWSPRVGAYQALREIQNKTDGVADHLLPNTRLRFAYADPKCDSTAGLTAALHLVQNAFEGAGVQVIVGAGCSAASVMAAHIAAVSNIPIVSPTSTSPTLDDGKVFPYFLRTIPSDSLGATAMVDILMSLWTYSSVALVHSTDAYGAGNADAFTDVAPTAGLSITITQSFAKDSLDFSPQQKKLLRSGARVLVLFCQTSDSGRFLRTALQAGVGGPGFLWLGGSALADSGLWEGDDQLASDPTLREQVFRGFFAVELGRQSRGTIYEAYLARRHRLPSTIGDRTSCHLEKDDDGTYLWAQDHDNNASSPLKCYGYDLSQDGHFDTFAYDAVFAVAHALHDLIEVQNRKELDGRELLDTLVRRVRFEGVTGLVDFYDASADPSRMHHGDPRVGVSYSLLNYYVDSTAQGLVRVGQWSPCEGASCGWSERWRPTSDVGLTYSTADNSRPVQTFACGYGETLTVDGTCTCDDGFEQDPASGQCRRCEVGQDSRRPTRNESGSGGCTICAEHYIRPSADSPVADCSSCETIQGVNCGSNTTIATLEVARGYWRTSPLTSKTYRCERNDESGDSACTGGTFGDALCVPGHTGPCTRKEDDSNRPIYSVRAMVHLTVCPHLSLQCAKSAWTQTSTSKTGSAWPALRQQAASW